VRLLVTRPERDGERTAALLRARGHEVIIAPLLRIDPVADADIGGGPWAAILVTSANAAGAIAGHTRFAELKSLPVLAVGERSAQAMRDVGFADVVSADGAGGDLTRLAAARLKQGVPLLYLAGADRSGDIAGDLGAQNYVVRTVVIYRAVAAEALPRAAAEALASGIDGVLHFSRRSAEAYVNAARAAGRADAAVRKPAHFCLSAHVAEPLTEAGATDIRIAAQPDEAALSELIMAA
jgi:uroporphyrinogen-III synthase